MTALTIYITPEEYAIGEKNGISNSRVYYRVNAQNWSIERAITTPVRQNKAKALYDEWKPVLDKHGISYETFRKRIKKNIPPEVAAQPLPAPKITKQHRELAAKNGIPEGTLQMRVYSYQWDPKRACTEPVNTKFRKGGWR